VQLFLKLIVFIAVRSKERGESARKEIQDSLKGAEVAIDVISLDVSDFDSVREFVAEIKRR
jgi:NAD(P)-dependent dehydrogenase (short-subunit alcohol dehydrogenase family)